MAGYTAAQIQAIRDKAAEIAIRGVARVKTADREYVFSSAEKLEAFAKSLEGQVADDTFGGFIDIIIENET